MEALHDSIVIRDDSRQRLSFTIIGQPHVDGGFDGPAKFLVVDDGAEAGDDTSVDQPLNSRTGRIRAQSDLISELAVTNSPVHLQMTEYFLINRINHSVYHCTRVIHSAFSVPHTEPSPA